jgi:uncharacterized radical SAM superfamily Fe-S cluster-containing enzyme
MKQEGDLNVCHACGSEFVHRIDCAEVDLPEHTWIRRRCPECGWVADGVYSDDELEPFDEELEAGTRTLKRQLQKLERENAAEAKRLGRECIERMVEPFVTALARDLITADDFRPRRPASTGR